MRKIIFAILVSVIVLGCHCVAYCQGYGSDDQVIDQSESQMEQGLGSEMSGDESQGQSAVSSMDSAMNTGGDGR